MTLEYFQSSTLTVKVSVLFYLQQTRHASALTSRREEAIRITLDYAHLLAARKLMRDSPEACISTFKTALDAFEVDMGYYPKGRNGLVDLIQQPREAPNWHGPYLQSDAIPKDPWGNDYLYECPGKHNPSFYDVSSAGPDGRFGTDDDICNWTLRK